MSQLSAGTSARPHVNITINDQRYRLAEQTMTGRALSGLAGVPDGNHLFLEVPGPGDDHQIQPDDVVELRSGMRFYDVPVGNFGLR